MPALQIKSELFNAYQWKDTQIDRETETSHFTLNQKHVFIEKNSFLDKKSAKTQIKNEIVSIWALYDSELAPYPGDVSHQIVFDEKLKPSFHKKKNNFLIFNYFLLYSNERFGIGVADPSQIFYKHLLGWFYCPQTHELYKIKIFFPKESEFIELEELFLSFSCNPNPSLKNAEK